MMESNRPKEIDLRLQTLVKDLNQLQPKLEELHDEGMTIFRDYMIELSRSESEGLHLLTWKLRELYNEITTWGEEVEK